MLIYLLILILNLFVVMFIAAGAANKPSRWNVVSVFVAVLALVFAMHQFETRQFSPVSLLSTAVLNLLLLYRLILIMRNSRKGGKS